MFFNHFKIAWRNLSRSKGYSLINITGLATGMAVTILIALWINDEITFNHNFENHSKIAQVITVQSANGEISASESTAIPVGKALETEFRADFEQVSFTSWPTGSLLAVGDKKLNATGRLVQPAFTKMFSLKMVERNFIINP